MNVITNGRPNHFSAILKQVVNAITALDIPLSKLILFGSAARGEYTINSDIDLAVITATAISSNHKKKVVHAMAEFETLETLLEINCFYATDESLENANHWSDPCIAIRSEGVVLWQKGHS